MKRILTIIDSVSEWSGRLISVFSFFLTFFLLYDVIARFAFNAPTIWCHELALHFFGAYAVLSGAYVLLHNGACQNRSYLQPLLKKGAGHY